MEYTQDNYADQDSVISQPFNPQSSELLFSTNDVNSFTRENFLNTRFELSHQEPSPWLTDSLYHDPAVFAFDVANDFLEAPRSDLGNAPFQSGIPSVYHAPNALNTREMAPESNSQVLLPGAAQQIIPPSPLRCNEPGCDNERVYSTASAFHKHQGKHIRLYECKYGSCNVRPFGDKAGLARHYREVHGSKVHYCPFRSCNRHKRGFGRRYNLLQHQEHCHGDQLLTRQRGTSESLSTEPPEHVDDHTQLGGSPSEDTERDSDSQSVIEGSRGNSGGEDKLERKLRHLKAKRDRINQAIATLECAQALVGGSSS